MTVEEIDFGEIQRVLDEILGNRMNFREMRNRGCGARISCPSGMRPVFCRMFFWRS